VYDLHGANTDWVVQEMNEKFGAYGVRIESFTITNVRLPHEIATTLEEKTLYVSKSIELKKKQVLWFRLRLFPLFLRRSKYERKKLGRSS